MAENVLQLRRREVPRTLLARAPLQQTSRTLLPITQNLPEQTDLDDDNAGESLQRHRYPASVDEPYTRSKLIS
jgi:hypothetical protein